MDWIVISAPRSSGRHYVACLEVLTSAKCCDRVSGDTQRREREQSRSLKNRRPEAPPSEDTTDPTRRSGRFPSLEKFGAVKEPQLNSIGDSPSGGSPLLSTGAVNPGRLRSKGGSFSSVGKTSGSVVNPVLGDGGPGFFALQGINWPVTIVLALLSWAVVGGAGLALFLFGQWIFGW